MKLLTIATTLALALTLAIPGTVAEPNEVQSGENGLCEDFNVLYNGPVHSPLTMVTVEGGSGYQLSHEGGNEISVDFFDADGNWLGYNAGGSLTGNAPAAAVYGTICVGQFIGWPTVPAPGATWTYQDGF